MDQTTFQTVTLLSKLLFERIPLSVGTLPAYSNDHLKADRAFIVREDNGTPSTLVNVFDVLNGTLAYTISRQSAWSTVWHIYSEPDRIQRGTLKINGFTRQVEIGGKTTLMRYDGGVLGKFHRHFYDNEHRLSWNRRSKFLERISNPGGGNEEFRERVASVDLLRNRRFDWEVQVNSSKVDPLLALATAFVTMKTQWPLTRVSHSAKPSTPQQTSDEEIDEEELNKWRVYEPKEYSKEPRNFFDPPKFLEHKYKLI